MGLYTQFFLYATAFLMLLNTFLVAGSLIVPFWIKIEIPGQAIRKGIFWECYNSTTLSATCKKLIFIDRVCPGTLPMVEASQLRLRYYAMRGLLITAIATSFLACISCILIALLRRRPTYSLWIPFGFILSTLCLIGPAILLYYYTEYRYANCHSIPCNGISSCRSSIAASWVMVLFAAFTCLTLTFLTCFAACWPFCCSMSRETKRKELLTQGLPPVEKPRYPELVIGRAPLTAHSTMRSALKREMTDLTAWSEDKAPKRAHAAVMSDNENSSEEEHNVRMGSWNSTHSGTTHPRPPFALPNRKPTSNGVDPVRRVVTEPFGEITRIPRRTDSELPPKEELEEAATENDTAPRSREWAFDRESGLYWSKRQEVYYDDYSGHFYDPQVEKWFDPVTSEWYELD